MGQKEVPSTLSIAAFYLVNSLIEAIRQWRSPGRYPRSAQVRRVSPTAPDLLSTSPVDNALFRPEAAAYGCAR
jgi:hypothetical protein